jgi:hypothetical protein
MWLLATDLQGDAVSPGTDVLLQYGAVGVVAIIFIYATYRLFTLLQESHAKEIARLESAHAKEVTRIEAAYDKEVARGDRIQSELGDLNKLINTKVAGQLVQSTDAIREALEIMHDRRRQ